MSLCQRQHCTQAQQSADFSVAVCKPDCISGRQQVASTACNLPASSRPCNQPRHQQPPVRYQEAVLRLNSAASSPDGSLARQQVATILHPTHSQNLHCTPPYLRSPPSSVTFCSEGIWKMKASLGACMQNKQEAGSAGASWSLHIACCTGWQRRIFCSCRRWRREWTAMSAQAESLNSFSQQAAFVLVLVIGTSRGACAHHSLEELHFAPGLLHQLGSHVEVAF